MGSVQVLLIFNRALGAIRTIFDRTEKTRSTDKSAILGLTLFSFLQEISMTHC